jgi:hypothetical protein
MQELVQVAVFMVSEPFIHQTLSQGEMPQMVIDVMEMLNSKLSLLAALAAWDS